MHVWAEVCHLLQSSKSPLRGSYAVLAGGSQAFFKHSPHTNSISNSAILHNNYISLLSDLCTCVHIKKQWRRKGSHSSSVSGSNRFVWLQTWKKTMGWCTAQWKMLLFCAKTIMKVSCKFELARLKKKKKEKHFGRLVTFGFGTFVMLFSTTGCVVRHENTWRWMVGWYNGL